MLTYVCVNSMRESIEFGVFVESYDPIGGVGLIGYCLCLQVRLVLMPDSSS